VKSSEVDKFDEVEEVALEKESFVEIEGRSSSRSVIQRWRGRGRVESGVRSRLLPL